MYTRAIKIGEAALGLEHPTVAEWLSNRAGLLHEQVRNRTSALNSIVPGDQVPVVKRKDAVLACMLSGIDCG